MLLKEHCISNVLKICNAIIEKWDDLSHSIFYFYVTIYYKSTMGGSLTIDILRKNIIDLILNEINNDESNISKMIIDYAKNNINTIINNDNIENDINWDELDQLFGSFSDNGVISVSENNEYILSIDETKLQPGEYTLRYIDENNNVLDSFDKITTFSV
jgi:hypothetical protein